MESKKKANCYYPKENKIYFDIWAGLVMDGNLITYEYFKSCYLPLHYQRKQIGKQQSHVF